MAEAACAGQWWLFDSTHPADHREAAQVCATCPILAECDDRARRLNRGLAYPEMTGTWAGRLYGYGKRQRRLLALEVSEDMAVTA